MARLVLGLGVNDAKYQVRDKLTGWVCPFYEVWYSMLRRCYSNYTKAKQPAYEGCTVCEEWLTFSVFKAWMEKQPWEDRQLDKDFLTGGNIYSPESCLFLPRRLNNLVIRRGKTRQTCLRGVVFIPSTRKYRARVNLIDSREHLGVFDSELEAHLAYLAAKLQIVKNYLQEFEKEDRVVLGLNRIASKLEFAILHKQSVEDL